MAAGGRGGRGGLLYLEYCIPSTVSSLVRGMSPSRWARNWEKKPHFSTQVRKDPAFLLDVSPKKLLSRCQYTCEKRDTYTPKEKTLCNQEENTNIQIPKYQRCGSDPWHFGTGPDPYLWILDPDADPGRPKTYGSGTLVHLYHFSKIKRNKRSHKTVEIKVLFFCLMIEGSGAGSRIQKLMRIRIRNLPPQAIHSYPKTEIPKLTNYGN